jgi:hypothetical protein
VHLAPAVMSFLDLHELAFNNIIISYYRNVTSPLFVGFLSFTAAFFN